MLLSIQALFKAAFSVYISQSILMGVRRLTNQGMGNKVSSRITTDERGKLERKTATGLGQAH